MAADQTGTARARYTLAALQTINVADTADLRPQLAAANTVTVTGTATSRPRHTLTGTNSAATSSAATATLVTFTRQRMQNGSVSNSFLPYVQVTGFTSDPHLSGDGHQQCARREGRRERHPHLVGDW